jgi:transcription elongation factor GreA-like protein
LHSKLNYITLNQKNKVMQHFRNFLLLLTIAAIAIINSPEAAGQEDYQKEKLISLWNHQRNLDLTDIIEDLGFNLVWTHDQPYSGQAWEDTHMYQCLQVPGIDYVFAKIERAEWGWTHEQSIRHAQWVAIMSKMHPGIIGMYLNDFYDEIEDGNRTEEQWREIIAAAKDINPDLQLWVPHYPHRDQGRHAFDFDIDGVILNLWGNNPELMARAEEHLAAGLAHHPNRKVIAGLYIRAGMDGGRLTERRGIQKSTGSLCRYGKPG